MSPKLPIPARVPLLYVILGVLLALSVVPMYFYSAQIEVMNRDRLKTNEMLLQNTVTRSLADDISQHQETLRMMLSNLASSIQVTTANDIGPQNISTPEMRALLEPLGAASPIAKFLERAPDGGIHHICYEVADIIAARDQLVAKGARVLGDGTPKIGAHGKRVLFLHPKDFCGTLTELEEA